MKISLSQITTSNVKTWEELKRYASQAITACIDTINGNLDYDNFKSTTVDVTFAAANTSTKVSHTLGRMPKGYHATNLSVSMVVYKGDPAYSDSEIFLKSSAIGTATIIVF